MTPRPHLPDARLRLLAARVHALGERPLFELFRELADGADLPSRLEVYARMDAATIATLGGRDLPEPLRVATEGRRRG